MRIGGFFPPYSLPHTFLIFADAIEDKVAFVHCINTVLPLVKHMFVARLSRYLKFQYYDRNRVIQANDVWINSHQTSILSRLVIVERNNRQFSYSNWQAHIKCFRIHHESSSDKQLMCPNWRSLVDHQSYTCMQLQLSNLNMWG